MSSKKTFIRKLRSLLLTRDRILRRIFLRLSNNFNWLAGPLLNEHCLLPESIGFHLTKRCNLHCQMCFLWANREDRGAVLREYKAEEMDPNRWLEIIDEVAFYKPSIGISGGESLLFENVLPIIRHIKSKKMYCSINTNGMLLEKYAQDLVAAKLDMVRVSIDGLPAIHDKIRGVKGSFSRLIKGIEKLNELKQRSATSLPVVEVYFTITNQNFKHMLDVLEIIEQKNINGIKFIHPLFMNQQSIRQCADFLKENLSIDKMDYLQGADIGNVNLPLDELLSEINKIKKRNNRTNVWFFPNFADDQAKEYYNDHEKFVYQFKGQCRVPWFTVNIKPNGDVETCPDYTFGNVADMKFLTVWNNTTIKKLRKMYRKSGTIPLCQGCCNPYRKL